MTSERFSKPEAMTGFTRRRFMEGLAAGTALVGWTASHASDTSGQARGKRWDRGVYEAEVQRRSQQQLLQSRLVVDYYRVGHRIAYPLPLASMSQPDISVAGIKQYPWTTWLLWTLEERITALGWAAEWFHDERAQQAAWADLAALAQWPDYQQSGKPNLSGGHAGRILWRALTQWRWIGEEQRRRLREACCRHVDRVMPKVEAVFGAIQTKADVLGRPAPHTMLHNIPLIGTVGEALAASAGGHAAASRLNALIATVLGASLDMRGQGISEGVGYDGYVLDFMADWLAVLPAEERRLLVEHPRFDDVLEESYMLGAPGAVERVAELSDVEPREMPFHLSAQAKLLRWHDGATRAWLMARCRVDWLRTDALAALADADHGSQPVTPRSGALDAHYASVLRSGWERSDLAAAVSCSTSPMGHIQGDNGTLVIGTRGKWFITDPGYQQYQPGEERVFTVGPTAHNAPLIQGVAPTQKRATRLALENAGADVRRLVVDLSACYPPSAKVKSLARHVWQAGNRVVVVADVMEAAPPTQMTYHWHGHPECAWWVGDAWAVLAHEDVQLWFTSPQVQLSGANVHRLPGSRGQLSLVAAIEKAEPVTWWVFVVAGQRPVVQLSDHGRRLQVEGRTFKV